MPSPPPRKAAPAPAPAPYAPAAAVTRVDADLEGTLPPLSILDRAEKKQ